MRCWLLRLFHRCSLVLTDSPCFLSPLCRRTLATSTRYALPPSLFPCCSFILATFLAISLEWKRLGRRQPELDPERDGGRSCEAPRTSGQHVRSMRLISGASSSRRGNVDEHVNLEGREQRRRSRLATCHSYSGVGWMDSDTTPQALSILWFRC